MPALKEAKIKKLRSASSRTRQDNYITYFFLLPTGLKIYFTQFR